ncbi:hypothetical protein D0Z08_19865 [Nocardioides immobilis]|uniref:Transmembrane protein n=1 Tax=Nocardioides immobilis TaxID=2049295 RepID=A0A417XXU3_9ACTN|nr:hypothetical protein [Nocardioides immobilis]RHW25222.1 hypothetical protein D0Z08_19865 [Nocardioides immobilis]
MKVAGALTLVVGFIVGLVLLLLPTSVSVFGTDADCGPPVIGMFGYDDGTDLYLSQQCQEQSVVRVGIGGLVGVVALVGGLLMLLLGPSAADREREERERFQRWQSEQQRYQWEQQHQQREQHRRFQPPPS